MRAELAELVVETLSWLRENRGIEVYVYCVMPDHVHLLLRPRGDLGRIVRSLKMFTTQESRAFGVAGMLW